MTVSELESHRTNWNSVVMGVFLLLGAVLMFILSLAALFLGVTNLASQSDPIEAGGLFILAAGLLGLGSLLAPGIFLNFSTATTPGNTPSKQPGLPNRILIPLILLIWTASLALGTLSQANSWVAILLLPLLNILAISLPVFLYLRICLNGLEMPSPKRTWSVFGATLLVAPSLAIIFEIFAVVLIILLYLVYASRVPGLTSSLGTLISAFEFNRADGSQGMQQLASIAFAPGVPAALLLTFSVAIPLIEETAKITVLWFYLPRLKRPVDGFILGVLCGAAFALTENLGFAGAGYTDWTSGAAARATAALPHIFNSGLLGWAIVSAWKEHRYARLATAFLGVVLIHGTWNAISLAIAFGEFSQYSSDVPAIFQTSIYFYTGWALLSLGTLLGIFLFNRRLYKNLAEQPPG